MGAEHYILTKHYLILYGTIGNQKSFKYQNISRYMACQAKQRDDKSNSRSWRQRKVPKANRTKIRLQVANEVLN